MSVKSDRDNYHTDRVDVSTEGLKTDCFLGIVSSVFALVFVSFNEGIILLTIVDLFMTCFVLMFFLSLHEKQDLDGIVKQKYSVSILLKENTHLKKQVLYSLSSTCYYIIHKSYNRYITDVVLLRSPLEGIQNLCFDIGRSRCVETGGSRRGNGQESPRSLGYGRRVNT